MFDEWFDSTILSLNVKFKDIRISKKFHRRDYKCATCEEIVFVTHTVYNYGNRLQEAVADHICKGEVRVPMIRMIRV